MYKSDELYGRGESLAVVQEYFDIKIHSKYIIDGFSASDRAKAKANKMALELAGFLVRSVILKNALYAAAEACGIKVEHQKDWHYRVFSRSGKVLVDLLQNCYQDRSYLSFPIEPRLKSAQRHFLEEFIQSLDDVLSKKS